MEKLVLDRKTAAEALDISLPTLDSYISRKYNPIPVIRVGRHIKIPVDTLREWLRKETMRQETEVFIRSGD